MLKVSKLLDYGLYVTVTIAKGSLSLYSASEISKITGLNVPTVRKLLNLLANANIVSSKRGVEGGYMLVKDTKEITVLDIVRAVEDDVDITRCSNVKLDKECKVIDKCTVNGYWNIMNNKVLDILSNTSIDDIVNYNTINK